MKWRDLSYHTKINRSGHENRSGGFFLLSLTVASFPGAL